MYNNEIFLNINELPQPLPKEELYSLIRLKNAGSKEAKDKLIEHNIRLVLYIVNKQFATVDFDKEELVGIGNIGLIKAIDTYNIDKSIEFTTYATKVIENEILMFLRKIKKDKNVYSLDDIISEDKNGNKLKFEDIIKDDKNFVVGYENMEVYKTIRKIVKSLPDKEREIVMLHFGFYDKPYTQKEIAKKFNTSQPVVSRILNKTLKDIENILKSQEILEPNLKTTKNRKDRTGKSIYQLLNNYSKEQIDATIAKLSDEEKKLIIIRYGIDLENPSFTRLSEKQSRDLYSYLIPKMRKLLANPQKEVKSRKSSSTKTNKLQIQSESNVKISKEDFCEIVKIIKNESFNQLTSTLSVKEAVIVSLKIGSIDGKYFSTESISEFLGIETTEVNEITKRALLKYKDKISKSSNEKKLERVLK